MYAWDAISTSVGGSPPEDRRASLGADASARSSMERNRNTPSPSLRDRDRWVSPPPPQQQRFSPSGGEGKSPRTLTVRPSSVISPARLRSGDRVVLEMSMAREEEKVIRPMYSPRPEELSPRDASSPEALSSAAAAAQQMHRSIKMLAKKGNPMSLLCKELREVLNGQDLLVSTSPSKAGPWRRAC